MFNIREEPSTDSAKIGSANKSTKLKYLGEQDGWYKVQVTDSKVGWIAEYLLRVGRRIDERFFLAGRANGTPCYLSERRLEACCRR